MPQGQLKINGKDAYTQWGVSLEDGALSLLMTPAPIKPFIENKSRLADGKSVIFNNPRIDERQITLVLLMVQPNQTQFMTKYNSFVSELQTGVVDVWTSFQSTVEYHCYFVSCTQFQQLDRRIAKMSVRLVEFNPGNRAVTQR